MRAYRGVAIERVPGSGYYRATVLVGGNYGYYRTVMADTVAGIRKAIAETLNRT